MTKFNLSEHLKRFHPWENHIFSLVCRNIHVRKLSHTISVPGVMKTLLLRISS
jgi:hypothetical protein